MEFSLLSDSRLIEYYIQGDENALEFLIRKHQNRIFNFIYSKVRNRDVANDLFQDVFIKVINTLKMGNYSEEGKFLPWVLRISHNLVIDYFRKLKRIPSFANSEDFDIFLVVKDDGLNMESRMIKDQIDSDVIKLLEELPDDQKEVLKMRIFQDMSFKEIADNTGVSINTALGRMRYALINLRKLIDKHQIIITH
ncbi:MAG: sigma-70 family RNA polymerase sigma factor [Flavobacteriaceae bacterium]|nr:sigma-70 family RNA polymerase sigma factor [Flavobacteriaceae bacterium]